MGNSKHNSSPDSRLVTKNEDSKFRGKDLNLNGLIDSILRGKTEELDMEKIMEEASIDPFVPLPKPPSIIEVGSIPLITRGNFSMISGKAKSRKTFYALKIILATLDNNSRFYKDLVNKVPYTNVTFFDTEQGSHHVSLFGNRVVKKLELKPETSKFAIFSLRKYSPDVRLKFIEYALYNSENLSLVVIDGVADLSSHGYLDDKDSIFIASKLLKWTQELNIHIVAVIHENKNNSESKGHLGAQLTQKAERVFRVAKSDKDDTISVITTPYSRNLDVPDDYIAIDENGIPVDTDAPAATASSKPLKNPLQFDYKFQLELIEQVFADVSELKYKQLISKMKYHLAESGHEIGVGKLGEWRTFYLERGIIEQEKGHMPYTLNTKFIQSERDKFETL